MKNHFIAAALFSLVSMGFTFAQKSDSIARPDKRAHVEAMIIPSLIYNSISLALSKPISENLEQAINFSAFAMLAEGPWFHSFAIRYNYNITVSIRKKITTYIPFWLSSRYLF